MLSNLSLGRKVALIPALTMLLMGLMLALAVRMGDGQTEALRALDRDVFEPLSRAQTLKDGITLLHARLFALLSLGTNEADRVAQSATAAAVLAQLDSTVADVANFLDTTRMVSPPIAKQLREAFAAYADQFSQTAGFAAYDTSYGEMLAGGLNHNFLVLRANLDSLVLALADRRAALASEAIGRSVNGRQRLLGLGLGAALVALLGSVIVGRSVAQPVQRLTVLMNRLAGGDTDLVVSGTGRRDEVGAIARAVEVFRANLIARRVGEIALRSANFQLDTALNSMLQGLLVYGPDRRVRLVNARFHMMLGLPADVIRPGMSVRELVDTAVRHGLWPGEDPDDVCARITMHLAERHSSQTDSVVRPGLLVRIAMEPMADGGAVHTFEDVTEKRQTEQQIAFMAHHDALTGLANRTQFREHLGAAVAGLENGQHFALLCLDLDHFKEVNDTLGHAAGDDLLRLVAERLRDCVRTGDMIARLGGDEFAIVLAGTTGGSEPVASLATRLVETIAAPYEVLGHDIVIGTSIGIAMSASSAAEPPVTSAELLKRADVALYRAKEQRGSFAFFEPGMEQALHTRRGLEAELRIAVRKGEFELDYQPIYNFAHDRVTSFEALVRWDSPTRGRVPPLDFIPIAEQTGLIVPLGEWVLRTACAEAASWPDHVSVAVNLSPVQFKSKRLFGMVREILEHTGLPARRLELEITETVMLEHTDAVMKILGDLHTLGVRISMDDFGTGYSSLRYLGLFPFDKIKIDRSFVRHFDVEPGDGDASAATPEPNAVAATSAATIVRAIIGLGEHLGISTLAEGVETVQQFIQLRAEGCHEVQGYFLGLPQPAGEVAGLMRRLDATLPSLRAAFGALPRRVA